MAGQSLPAPDRILVRKYGGSSLATVPRIRVVARDLATARQRGHQLVVVVSAMGQTTDELARLAHAANAQPPRRELDMLLSVGERVTMSLLSMALAAENCPAISFTGSQCGIITDTSHTDAHIIEVKGDRVRAALADGMAVIVAGFQGVSLAKEITTLGRGGSDTTAVALAAALGAVRCEILKDVDGVMSADPRLVRAARRHDRLSYDEMRQIASGGCGVVHLRAVEYAARHGVQLYVGSSFHEGPGTIIGEAPAATADAPGHDVPRQGSPDQIAPEPAAADAPSVATSTEPPGADESKNTRYRPLTMACHTGVAYLALNAPHEPLASDWCELVSGNPGHGDLIAEWFREGSGFDWAAIATEDSLGELATTLRACPGAVQGLLIWERDLACLTLTGCRPESWLAVKTDLQDLLAPRSLSTWRVLSDGSALRLLVPAAELSDLPELIHATYY